MLIKFFKNTAPVLIVVLAIYTLFVNLNLYFDTPTPDLSTSAPLSQLCTWLLSGFVGQSTFLLAGLHIFLVFIQALILNRMVERYKLTPKNTALPALSYILLTALFNQYIFLSSALLAVFPIIFVIDRIFESYNNKKFTTLFDIGFYIGIASLFFLPSLLLVLLMFVVLLITRIFDWREWVVSITGILIPYILIGTYFFMIDEFGVFANQHFFHAVTGTVELKIPFTELCAKMLLLLVLISLGTYFLQVNIAKSVVKTRKFLTILVYLLTVTILIFLFINPFSLAPISLVAIPLAILLGYSLFSIDRHLFSEGIHLVILSIILFFEYIYRYF